MRNGRPPDEYDDAEYDDAGAGEEEDGRSFQLTSADIELLEEIGDGVTSVVFRGRCRGMVVAVKEMGTEPLLKSQKARLNLERELEILSKVKHPNLVTFVGVAKDTGKVRIVTEYCAGGAAFDLLHNTDLILSWDQKFKMASDTAEAMQYLHAFNPPIVHRDLKSLNLLLQEDITTVDDPVIIKVADFGLSRMISQDTQALTKDAGTYHWMAPEVFGSNSYDRKADVYSFSMILYEIICQTLPFGDLPARKLGLLVVKGQRPNTEMVPSDCPPVLSQMMLDCWAAEPTERPDFHYLCYHLRPYLPVDVGGT